MKTKLTSQLWMQLGMLIIVISTSLSVMTGWISQHSIWAEGSDYLNPTMPPASLSLMWWPLYFVMMLVIFWSQDQQSSQAYKVSYQKLVFSKMFQWMAFNILLFVSWYIDWPLLSLIIVSFYLKVLLTIVERISQTGVLRSSPMRLKYPMGFHFGWLISILYIQLGIYLTAQGANLSQLIWLIIMLLILSGLMGLSFYYFIKLGNQAILIPIFILLISQFIQHSPFSAYQNRSYLYMYLIAFIFIVAMVAYLSILKLMNKS